MPILDRFRIDDKVALVTGAGRGIGRATALALAENGADVALAARSEDQLQAVAEEIRKLGRKALVVPTNAAKTENLEAFVAQTMDTFGRIDIVINNVGGSMPKDFLSTTEKDFEGAFHFNVTTKQEANSHPRFTSKILQDHGENTAHDGFGAHVRAGPAKREERIGVLYASELWRE